MIFVSTKQRLLQYLEFKGISIKEFFSKTEIKRGFLDTDKLNGTVSDIFITKIIETFPDLNLRWLLTGSGKMTDVAEKKVHETSALYNVGESESENSDCRINDLKEMVAYLKDQNSQLLKIIADKSGNQKAS